MLVLSRKSDESIWIGQDIRVTVVSVEGGRVRLGIEAPRSLTVLRDELRHEVEIELNDATAVASECGTAV